MTTSKIVDKIIKIRNHMQSAEKIGNIEEAEKFAAMMQKLMDKHTISLTDLEYQEYKTEEIIEMDLDQKKHGIQHKKTRIEWQESLASIVAKAHNCAILVRQGSNVITFVGTRSDVQVAEYVFVTMSRLAESFAQKAYVKYYIECRNDGDVTMARGYKASFLRGFLVRLQERLRKNREDTIIRATAEEAKRGDRSSTALIRLSQAMTRVNEYMKKPQFKSIPAASGRKLGNRDGYADGKAAADKVNLGGKAVQTNKPAGHLR